MRSVVLSTQINSDVGGYDAIRRILEYAAGLKPMSLQSLKLFPPYLFAEDMDTIVVMPRNAMTFGEKIGKVFEGKKRRFLEGKLDQHTGSSTADISSNNFATDRTRRSGAGSEANKMSDSKKGKRRLVMRAAARSVSVDSDESSASESASDHNAVDDDNGDDHDHQPDETDDSSADEEDDDEEDYEESSSWKSRRLLLSADGVARRQAPRKVDGRIRRAVNARRSGRR